MNNSILSEPFEDVWYCQEIKKCKPLKRVQCVLHFYQFLQNDQKNNNKEIAKLLIDFLSNNKYQNLINDYHHILDKHLNQNNDDYDYIQSSISKYITCDITNCSFYLRNQRDRENDDDQQSINKIINDQKSIFYIDTLDNIHTYFLHGYDTGLRTKINYETHKDNDNDNDNDDEDDDDKNDEYHDKDLYHDGGMINLRQHLHEKRKRLESIRGENRMKHNKFSTQIEENISYDIYIHT